MRRNRFGTQLPAPLAQEPLTLAVLEATCRASPRLESCREKERLLVHALTKFL